MTEPIELRLKWRQTWADRENDFVAKAPGFEGSVGRIFFQLGGINNPDRWFWTMNATVDGVAFSNSGHAATARDAARHVEDIWFRDGLRVLEEGRKRKA